MQERKPQTMSAAFLIVAETGIGQLNESIKINSKFESILFHAWNEKRF
jgi:hypothetical protein